MGIVLCLLVSDKPITVVIVGNNIGPEYFPQYSIICGHSLRQPERESGKYTKHNYKEKECRALLAIRLLLCQQSGELGATHLSSFINLLERGFYKDPETRRARDLESLVFFSSSLKFDS